jgi:alkaline phosphatase
MGAAHVNLTESYLSNINNSIGIKNLTISGFPNFGYCSTYCKNRQITDSGAAGSAIACGQKADVGVISFYPSKDSMPKPISIAKIAHNNGLKVGIITSVSIDHATPAAFYAVNESRSNYYEIGLQLAESGFEFFGGGGFLYQDGKDKTKPNLYDLTENAGYKIYRKYDDLKNISPSESKVMFVNPVLLSEAEMPYAIDRQILGGAALSEIVTAGIKYLDNDKGFFIMVEGGKIDWASHENDAATIVNEVKDFDNAIFEAYQFYLAHPDETLIIVTADHETSGLSLGIAEDNYDSDFAYLKNQKCSQYYLIGLLNSYKKVNTTYSLQEAIDIAQTNFFDEKMEFTKIEMEQIKLAYNNTFSLSTDFSKEEFYKFYGGYNPLAVTFNRILNNRASVGFSSWSHTAAYVPVYSIGKGSENFSGYIDNTDIKPKIMNLMGW